MALLGNQQILTLDYWKRVDQLQEGDWVFNRFGQPVQITLVQKYTPAHCYEIAFSDDLTIAGDEKLKFLVEDRAAREQSYHTKATSKVMDKMLPKTMGELTQEPLPHPTYPGFKYSIPTTLPIQTPHQDLPVPPFVFGFWFFNRKKDRCLVPPLNMEEIVHAQFKDAGYKVKKTWATSFGRKRFRTTPTIESQLVPNIPVRIPNNYLMASAEQRMELLRGILHAKKGQYRADKDMFRISTQNQALTRQIQWLVESLGHTTSWVSHKRVGTHTIFFKSRHPLMENQRQKPPKRVLDRRFIHDIYEIAPQQCVHIQTTEPILVGEGFIACH